MSGKMSLGNVTSGLLRKPLRVVLYGPEGVGKSTFGADAPSPIFLGAEDGTARLDVARFPQPESWADVLEAIKTLGTEQHNYKTLVVDTLDWVEPLCWKHACSEHGWKSVEDPGYGKGYAVALDLWRQFLQHLERLQSKTSMHVVLLAHSQITKFADPLGNDFDRYELKLNKKAAGLLKEWPDAVLFCNYETRTARDKATKRTRGISTGARWVYTTRDAAYDAKNRYGLPERMPLSFGDLNSAVERGAPADCGELTKVIEEMLTSLRDEDANKAKDSLKRVGNDATKLRQLLNWCEARAEAKEESEC